MTAHEHAHAKHLVEIARDADELDVALGIAAQSHAVDASWTPLFARLSRETWHQEHEDLIFQLANFRDSGSLDALVHATQWVPDYLAWDENRGLAVKAIWGLRLNPSPDAISALIDLTASDDPVIAESARDRLLDRIEDSWLPLPPNEPDRTTSVDIQGPDGSVVTCSLRVTTTDNRCTLHLTAPDQTTWTGDSVDLWFALKAFRRALHDHDGSTVLIQASRRDVHRSAQASSAAAYVLTLCQPWSADTIAEMLAPARADQCGTIAEQDAHHRAWLRSLLPWPLAALGGDRS